VTTPWLSMPDLAARVLGGGVVAASDEFFGAADLLLTPEPPQFRPHTFGPKGQLYDGWETRRRREPGHDDVIVRLGAPGIVHGVVIDTAFFLGNYPPHASVEACAVAGHPSPAELAGADWHQLLPPSPLRGGSTNEFTVDSSYRFTHVRLHIYPDGGVARLRVHGEVVPDPALVPGRTWDLAALAHGGLVVDCSDRFYGSPGNLLVPGPARSMGEGWETARRRDGGNDWVRVRLAAPGRIRLVELDTSHFKGNSPGAAGVRGVDARTGTTDDLAGWFDILPRTRLQPDTRHRFPVVAAGVATHLRLDIYPDGGMARLRAWGRVSRAGRAALADRLRACLPPPAS
jgi:allantoicase